MYCVLHVVDVTAVPSAFPVLIVDALNAERGVMCDIFDAIKTRIAQCALLVDVSLPSRKYKSQCSTLLFLDFSSCALRSTLTALLLSPSLCVFCRVIVYPSGLLFAAASTEMFPLQSTACNPLALSAVRGCKGW